MEIVKLLTPNYSSRNKNEIIGIVLHFTAGGDSNGTVKWFNNPDSHVSAHYVVSRSGKIIQMVEEANAAWHAGSSTTTPKMNGVKNLNLKTIGIEICNWGWLLKADNSAIVTVNNKTYERKVDEFYTRLRKWTYPYKGPNPVLHKVTSKVLQKSDNPFPQGETCYFWEPFATAQVDAVVQLIREIVDRYPKITRDWVQRHQDVDPTRKLDTGPAFNYESVLDRVFEPNIDIDQYQIGNKEEDHVTSKDMLDAYEGRDCNKRFCL